MNDFRIGARGTFSELYAAAERAQGDAGVRGGKVLFEMGSTFDFASLGTKNKLLSFGGIGRLFSARIADAIQKEYGEKVTEAVFKKVLGQKTSERPIVTLDNLRALKNELSYQLKKSEYRGRGLAPVKFSTIARQVAAFKKDKGDIKDNFKRTKHLRFTSEKNIYFHTKWSTGFKAVFGLQASRVDKRAAAGGAIWKAIANELGQKSADIIFTNVFGTKALLESGHKRNIAVTIAQFEAIEAQLAKLDAVSKIIHERVPAPHDVMTALFGPRGNNDKTGNTKAAFQRLENVLPDDAVQALRDRSHVLLTQMSHPDRVRSMLDRSVGKNIANQVWNEVLEPDRPPDQRLEAQDILDLCATAHVRAAYSLVPATSSLGIPSNSDIPPEPDNSLKSDIPQESEKSSLNELPKSDIPLEPDNPSKTDIPQKPDMSSRQAPSLWPGVRIDASTDVNTQKIVLRPGVTKQDARAYDDLKQIEAIVTATEQNRLGSDLLRKRGKNGSIRPNQAAIDIFTLRIGEIHTLFRKRLKENVTAKTYNNELRQMFQKKVSSKAHQRPAMARNRGRDPADLLRNWVALADELQDLDRKIKTAEKSRKRSAVSALISKRNDLKMNALSAMHAYQTHPWTERMVEEYGHLGFQSDLNYTRWNDAAFAEIPLRKDTVAAFDEAANLAEKLVVRLADLLPPTIESGPGYSYEPTGYKPPEYMRRKSWIE